MSRIPRYVVISPVKDEAAAIEHTLQSMVAQTLKPTEWIIVDDDSSDTSPEIVSRYAERHSFIRPVPSDRHAVRQPGRAVIQAFNRGLELIDRSGYDFIVKLDGDLSFSATYFEQLIDRFLKDERLGIASGIYLETDIDGTWQPVGMPWYHAFGACKVVRRQCFDEIGGFVAATGWDTVDEIKAMSRGWRTRHFTDLHTHHHKREGTGIGILRTSRMHGEVYYVSGGDPLLFVFKVMRRLAKPPRPLNALSLLFGYIAAVAGGKPRLVNRSEARLYRALLRRRLLPVRAPGRLPALADSPTDRP